MPWDCDCGCTGPRTVWMLINDEKTVKSILNCREIFSHIKRRRQDLVCDCVGDRRLMMWSYPTRHVSNVWWWLAKIYVSVYLQSSLWTSALISGGNNLLVYKCIIIFFICETLKVRSTRKQHENAREGKGILSEYCTTSVACLYTRVMTWSCSPLVAVCGDTAVTTGHCNQRGNPGPGPGN